MNVGLFATLGEHVKHRIPPVIDLHARRDHEHTDSGAMCVDLGSELGDFVGVANLPTHFPCSVANEVS